MAPDAPRQPLSQKCTDGVKSRVGGVHSSDGIGEPNGIYDAGICKDHIDTSLHLSNHFVETIKIIEFRDISLNGRYILPDQRYRLIQLRLPTPGDKHVGPFLHEALGCGQADSAIATSDYLLPLQVRPFLLL